MPRVGPAGHQLLPARPERPQPADPRPGAARAVRHPRQGDCADPDHEHQEVRDRLVALCAQERGALRGQDLPARRRRQARARRHHRQAARRQGHGRAVVGVCGVQRGVPGRPRAAAPALPQAVRAARRPRRVGPGRRAGRAHALRAHAVCQPRARRQAQGRGRRAAQGEEEGGQEGQGRQVLRRRRRRGRRRRGRRRRRRPRADHAGRPRAAAARVAAAAALAQHGRRARRRCAAALRGPARPRHPGPRRPRPRARHARPPRNHLRRPHQHRRVCARRARDVPQVHQGLFHRRALAGGARARERKKE